MVVCSFGKVTLNLLKNTLYQLRFCRNLTKFVKEAIFQKISDILILDQVKYYYKQISFFKHAES